MASLLGWILSWWQQSECRLALGMDVTTLADRFTVLCISVLYRGCAIPAAWKVLRGGEKGAWEPYWRALVTSLKGVVPKHWTVLGWPIVGCMRLGSSATSSRWAGTRSCASI